MAYKQKGCTPITAKIQKGTKGGVTNPLLKAMGVPMKKSPSVAKQTSMGPVPLPKESNSVVQDMAYYSSDVGKAMSKSVRENKEKAKKDARNKNLTPKQKEFYKKKHQGRYYKEPAKTNITKKADVKGKGAGSVTVANNPGKSSSGKITGKIGSDLRKAQYDKKGWKYDDTIKGYDKSGNKIKTSTSKVKTADVRAPKVNMDSKLTKAPSYDTSKITGKPKASATAKPSKKVDRKQKAIDVKLTKAKAARASGNDRKADRKERAAQRKKDRLARKDSPAKNYKKGYYGK